MVDLDKPENVGGQTAQHGVKPLGCTCLDVQRMMMKHIAGIAVMQACAKRLPTATYFGLNDLI